MDAGQNYQKPKANKTRTVSIAAVGEDMAAVVVCEGEGEGESDRARVGRGSVEGRHDDFARGAGDTARACMHPRPGRARSDAATAATGDDVGGGDAGWGLWRADAQVQQRK
jgi:hypothetical protein